MSNINGPVIPVDGDPTSSPLRDPKHRRTDSGAVKCNKRRRFGSVVTHNGDCPTPPIMCADRRQTFRSRSQSNIQAAGDVGKGHQAKDSEEFQICSNDQLGY